MIVRSQFEFVAEALRKLGENVRPVELALRGPDHASDLPRTLEAALGRLAAREVIGTTGDGPGPHLETRHNGFVYNCGGVASIGFGCERKARGWEVWLYGPDEFIRDAMRRLDWNGDAQEE